MVDHTSYIDASSIVVGVPLPFSVYSAERKLLLAKGRVVESERVRHLLIQSGRFQGAGTALELSEADITDDPANAAHVEDALTAYAREFNAASAQSRIGVRLSRDDSSESFTCWVLGADEVHGLIVTAPSKADRSLLPVAEGQTWVFRLLYLTAVCKFTGTIRKVQFDPVPLLNVSLPRQVEMRHIRASPRVATCFRGSIKVGNEIPALITDVAIGGVCIAVERSRLELKHGTRTVVGFCITMLGTDYNFKVPAVVVSIKHEMDKRYPELQFAGLKIEAQSETERLVLHGFVFERTAMDFNALWKALVTSKV